MIGGWKIVYWSQDNRESPIYSFIQNLPYKTRQKVYYALELLSEFNIQLRSPHVKKVTGTKLWELRILGEDSSRIFYIAVIEKQFLLLHGFLK